MENIFCSAQKGKVRLQKEKRERITHILEIQRGTSQYTKKKTVMNTHQLKITGSHQDMESRLEKQTHFLNRAKGELSGHRMKGSVSGTCFLKRTEPRTGQDMEIKLAGALTP